MTIGRDGLGEVVYVGLDVEAFAGDRVVIICSITWLLPNTVEPKGSICVKRKNHGVSHRGKDRPISSL
jgi:threonine dehydrogenase-like Zn-dependent dehydrogenase